MQDFKIRRNETQWKTSCRCSKYSNEFYKNSIVEATIELIEWFDNEYNAQECTEKMPEEYLYNAIQELKECELDYSLWYTQVCKEEDF